MHARSGQVRRHWGDICKLVEDINVLLDGDEREKLFRLHSSLPEKAVNAQVATDQMHLLTSLFSMILHFKTLQGMRVACLDNFLDERKKNYQEDSDNNGECDYLRVVNFRKRSTQIAEEDASFGPDNDTD